MYTEIVFFGFVLAGVCAARALTAVVRGLVVLWLDLRAGRTADDGALVFVPSGADGRRD